MIRNLIAVLVLVSLSEVLAAQCISGNCVNGSGIMVYSSGARYVGEFRNGAREGLGTCFYTDGSNYQGNWRQDRPEGAGIKTFSDGMVKKGYWRQGILDREDPALTLQIDGKANHLTGGCIAGNCLNGNGNYIYANGDIYIGDFVNGRRQGIGVCYYANRSEYKGRWVADMPDGRGTMTYADGRSQTGIWKMGRLNEAQGQPVFSNIYKKEIQAEKPKPQSQCLSGDCQNGYGTFLFQDSSRYTGTFREGLPEGQGVIYYPNGERYEGMIQSGQLHGRGTMYFPDGRRISGYWDKGIYVQSIVAENQQPTPAPVQEVKPERPTVKVWAVIVGIASYSHMQVLRYTDDDAYRIYAFLKAPEGGAVPDEQIRLLIDEAATRNNVLRAMQEVFYKAGPNDLVLMYYSGHGLPGTFLPIDYDGLNNQIRHEEINQILRQSPAKLKLFIADACHSGGMVATRDPLSSPLLKNYYATLAQAQPGTALIMSSKSEETSLEASGLRQGVFSYFLIRGMKGDADVNKDGIINLQELFDYVFVNVRQYTRNFQSPVIQGDYDPKMTISVYQRQ